MKSSAHPHQTPTLSSSRHICLSNATWTMFISDIKTLKAMYNDRIIAATGFPSTYSYTSDRRTATGTVK